MTEENTTQDYTEKVSEAGQESEAPKVDETQAEKTDETILSEDKAVEEKDSTPEKVEEIDYKFEEMEGLSLDNPSVDKFKTVAKDLGLKNDDAQKLLTLASDHMRSLSQAQQDHFVKTRETWVNSLREDKEFGGGNFNDTVANAQKVVRDFGSPELSQFLKQGYGDHPELIKLFAKIGRSIGEDKPVDGGPTRPQKSMAEIIYGDS